MMVDQTLANARFLLIGIAIALPWLALSLVAAVPLAGDLLDYYCFPLLFAFFWPLFLAETLNAPQLMKIQIVMGAASTAAFILFGLLPFVGDAGLHDRAPWSHLVPPRSGLIAATQTALANNPHAILDDGAATLAIARLRPGQFSANDAFTPAQIMAARTYIHFTTAPAQYISGQAHALAMIFPDCHHIPSTRLEICKK